MKKIKTMSAFAILLELTMLMTACEKEIGNNYNQDKGSIQSVNNSDNDYYLECSYGGLFLFHKTDTHLKLIP